MTVMIFRFAAAGVALAGIVLNSSAALAGTADCKLTISATKQVKYVCSHKGAGAAKCKAVIPLKVNGGNGKCTYETNFSLKVNDKDVVIVDENKCQGNPVTGLDGAEKLTC